METPEKERPLRTISLFGIKLPLTPWSRRWLSVIMVFGAAGLVYQTLFPSTPELLTLKEANARLVREMEEYGAHLMDKTVFEHEALNGELLLKVYADGCLAIQRRTARATLTRLVMDIGRPLADAVRGQSHVLSMVDSARGLDLASFPDVTTVPGFTVAHAADAQGRCWNPHPGPFQSRYGQRHDQCWVEVWRSWPDGCQHVQMFNTCGSFWATNPDGTPNIRWTHCRH